ncbi:MAG: metallophosphoesterase [Pirellulaceae bacterium]
MWAKQRTNFAATALVAIAVLRMWYGSVAHAGEELPLATIAVISNPYITTLPPQEIRDERGSVRDFLSTTGPPSLKQSIQLVNELEPDVFVIQGSLTWSGTEADFATFDEHLNTVRQPVYLTPGHLDRRNDSFEAYLRRFAKYDVSNSIQDVNGVQLLFANDLHANPSAAVDRMTEQLKNVESKAVLVFAGKETEFSRSKLTSVHPFWNFIKRSKVAARFDPTRYSHQILYEKSLPIWTVGSSAWSARGAVTVIRIYTDRVTMTELRSLAKQSFSISIPNPVTRDRLKTAENDEYQSPSYSENLAKGPAFTFALVSDPQFDRERNRDTLIRKAENAIQDLNRLDPQIVFVAGDLVNNNLPEEWAIFNEVFSKLKPNRTVVPGNHDVLFNYNFVEATYASAAQKNPRYAAIVKQALDAAAKEGFSGPAALFEKFTGSKPSKLIQFGDCAFITTPLLTTRADPEEIQRLGEHLGQTAKHRHVFVIAHYPSLPSFGNNVQPQLGGTEILGLLHQHRVTGFLFGHRHRNGFEMHERTAHVLSDNMGSIHLFHIFSDHIVIGRKRVNAPLYETLTIPSSR